MHITACASVYHSIATYLKASNLYSGFTYLTMSNSVTLSTDTDIRERWNKHYELNDGWVAKWPLFSGYLWVKKSWMQGDKNHRAEKEGPRAEKQSQQLLCPGRSWKTKLNAGGEGSVPGKSSNVDPLEFEMT